MVYSEYDTNSLKFRIGTRRFKLQDVANNQIASDLITTSSFADIQVAA